MKKYITLALLLLTIAGCATIDTFFNRKARFQEFKSGFAEGKLPFSVDSNMNCGMVPGKVISSKYRKFLPQYLKRFAGRGFEPAGKYVAHLHKDSVYDLYVVYFNMTNMIQTSRLEFYQLISFDKKGYIIDKLDIAGLIWGDTRTSSIDKNMVINVKDIDKRLSDANAGKGLKQSLFYHIDHSGHFIKDKQIIDAKQKE